MLRSWIGATAALLIAMRVATLLHATGEFRHLNNELAHTGRCHREQAPHRGFEDFAVFTGGEIVALSADHAHFAFRFGVSMRQRLMAGQHRVVARVLRGGTWRSFTLHGHPTTDFAPHGLAAWGKFGSRRARLLVVNHRTTHDTLELFAATSRSAAVHLSSLSHPLLWNVNDCSFADGASVVYCTNWRSYETGTIMDAVELYGQQPWSNVVGCRLSTADGAPPVCEIAAHGLAMANGIEVQGELVFVVASTEPAIHVYTRRSGGGGSGLGLELAYKMATRPACDNLVWDGTSLLAACHARALTFVAYSKAPRQRHAPCEVLRFDDVLNTSRRAASRGGIATTYPTTIGTTVYVDSVGDEFSACSVAAVVKATLWLGSVHDEGMLRCEL